MIAPTRRKRNNGAFFWLYGMAGSDRREKRNATQRAKNFLDSLPMSGAIMREMESCAYLDIETTSLSPADGELTVVGVYLHHGTKGKVIQLVGDEISAVKLDELTENVQTLYTYNGERFDLPYIKAKLGLDLTQRRVHRDLMYDCWRNNLYGGLKAVERQLGIRRQTAGIDGRMAVQLWCDYQRGGNATLLETLLKYNREDVLSLKMLRNKLRV
jgi:uncharacterized protein YprB with RNaseH-like and TPR domain